MLTPAYSSGSRRGNGIILMQSGAPIKQKHNIKIKTGSTKFLIWTSWLAHNEVPHKIREV